MLDKRIEFDDSFIHEEEGTITLFFTGPKELLVGDYPEAESMELSVECPIDNMCANCVYDIEMSPTMYDEDEEGYTDYDWVSIYLPDDEVDALIQLAKESGRL